MKVNNEHCRCDCLEALESNIKEWNKIKDNSNLNSHLQSFIICSSQESLLSHNKESLQNLKNRLDLQID